MGATPREVSIVVGGHPFLDELRRSQPGLSAARLVFDESYSPTNRAFRPMAMDQAFDFSEMAMATYVQARAAGKPVVALPVPLLSRFQHQQLVRHVDGPDDPAALVGGTVAVRSYSQTTGVWVRALLRTQYGVDSGKVAWRTFEGAHVDGFPDPPNVTRADASVTLKTALTEHGCTAAIGKRGDDPRVRFFFDSPGAEARAWYAATEIVPINHVLTVREQLLDEAPDLVEEVVRAFQAALRSAPPAAPTGDGWEWLADVDLYPVGGDRFWAALRLIADEVVRQQVIPGPLPETLVDPRVATWA
jgi:4,5-dihydroxyphthalate decarboxylase